MTRAALVLATLVCQRLLGWPGMPFFAPELLLPMVWIVGPPMLHHGHNALYLPVLIGLGCDLLMEPVIGPGAIAWSAAALAVGAIAGIVADRSPRAWFVFGGVGAVLVLLTRHIALLPLGLATPLGALHIARTAVLTAVWCGLAGWILSLDLPIRWQRYRARRLR